MSDAISIFFSYASEDQTLVDAIVEALDDAFRNSITTKNMSQFDPGTPYRQEIDDSLDRADILLVVASGKEKLSHTFSGYEVGYFRKSQRTRRFIRQEESQVERIIIPMAVLTDLPDTVSEIQGVKIPASDQIYVPAGVPNAAQQAMHRLLIRVDQIIIDLENRRRNADESAKVNKTLTDASREFAEKLPRVLRRIAIAEIRPATKLTIYLPPNIDPYKDNLPASMMVTVTGPTRQIFAPQLPANPISWDEFEKVLGEDDIALSW